MGAGCSWGGGGLEVEQVGGAATGAKLKRGIGRMGPDWKRGPREQGGMAGG